MYLIDATYFKGFLSIPTIDDIGSKNLAELERIIDERSRYLLRNCLNDFADFDSYLVDGFLPPVPADPDPDPVPAKWRELVEGKSYTDPYGNMLKWKGLAYSEGSYKGSVLAWFAYFFFARDNVSFLSGVGDVKAKAKNANAVDPTPRLVEAWRTFLKMYQGNYYNGCGCCIEEWWWYWDCEAKSITDYSVSLLQFLSQNTETYGDFRPVIYESPNVWGI